MDLSLGNSNLTILQKRNNNKSCTNKKWKKDNWNMKNIKKNKNPKYFMSNHIKKIISKYAKFATENVNNYNLLQICKCKCAIYAKCKMKVNSC